MQNQKLQEKKNSFCFNLKEEKEIDFNVVEVIQMKKQRNAHSNPKNSKKDEVNLSRDKKNEIKNVKKYYFLKIYIL